MQGVAAEHVKLASNEIITILTTITNKMLKGQRHPSQFKLSKIIPVLKKGKPAKDPNEHGKITVPSKVVEKEFLSRTKPTISVQPKNANLISPKSIQLLTLPSSSIAEAKDAGNPCLSPCWKSC